MTKHFSCFIILSVLLLSFRAGAQTAAYPYQFTSATGTAYTPLSNNATELIGSTGWDDEIVPFTLPFNFYYTGTLVQSWVMDTYGGLYPVGANDGEEIPPILGFFSDYVDRGNSWIGYEVAGSTGNRIAKVEYRSVGYFSDTLHVDSASFQIWLYEGSNKIEYHAGPSMVDPDRFNVLSENGDLIFTGLNYTNHSNDTPPGEDTFHFVGRVDNLPKDSVIVFDAGSGPPDPEMINFINYGMFPASGTVFTFTPPGVPPVAIRELEEEKLSSLFPNPVTDDLVLRLKKAPEKGTIFIIYDVAGRELLRENIEQQRTTISLSALTKGIYMATILSSGKKEITRIVKQ